MSGFTREAFLPDPDERNPPLQASSTETEASIAREARDIAQRLIAAPALAHDPELPREWIVKDLIPDANLSLLTGEGGVGKSTLATQLAAAMQIDGEWLGMRVTQGGVLFVSTEDERKDIKLSLSAVLKAEDKSVAHCPGLHILSLADRDACLAAAPAKLAAIEATPLWHALDHLIDRLKPRLAIFDALADMFGGEENSRRHVRGFIVLLKRLAITKKLAVLLVAHPSLSGVSSGTGLSGSTDWHNGPRARLYFQRPNDGDGETPDRDARELIVKKSQYSGAEGTVFRLRRRDGRYVYEGKTGSSAPYDRAATSAKADRKFLDLLAELTAQGRDVSPTPSRSYAPAVFADHPDADGVTKKALALAMERLLKGKRIAVETVGPPSKQRKRIVIVLDSQTSETESP